MNEHSDPIQFLIDFAWASGADRFVVNNAKDELKKLKSEIETLKKNEEGFKQYYNYTLKINQGYEVIGCGRVNDRGDIYDLRICYNPYIDESTVLPVYANKLEYEARCGKLS